MTDSSVSDLDQLHVRFVTYRDLPVEDRTAAAAGFAAVEADERVLLDTCHRVELVSVERQSRGGAALRGRAAVRRVFEVVAGFDSAVVAEEQLIGQVRGAFESALADGRTGPVLNELFRRALRYGRQVRTHARPGTDRSLADPAVQWLLERLPVRSRVAVGGTGEMGRLIAGRLAEAGHRITVVSGSADRGGGMLESLGGTDHHLVVGPLTAGTVASVAAVALAVRGREPLLRLDALGDARPWVLDLSAPPAVATAAAERLGDRLMTLDGLGDGAAGRPVLDPDVERRLRAELDREVERFVAWLAARRGNDALAVLHGEADAVRRRHLDRLRRRAGLDDAQLAAVEAASAAMLGELLHGPSLELRRGGDDAATVRRLFGLDA